MNTTVKSAAFDLAKRGLRGVVGDPLPRNMSNSDVVWINANQPAFRVAISTYRIILRCQGAK